MKDAKHHLHKLQKKVIQKARKEAEKVEEVKRERESEELTQEIFAIDDPDNKRKGPSDCVRHMTQRERMH